MYAKARLTLFVVAATLLTQSVARSQPIATFDESSTLFLLADFSTPGAVTATPDSIVFDVEPPADAFAGVAGTLFIPEVDFAPSDYQLEVRFRLLPDNNVPGFGVVYAERDDGFFVPESWVFQFDISALTPADDWTVVRQRFDNPVVTGTNDGVQNPDLELLAIVIPNAPDPHLHLELDYLRIIPIPEPSCLALLGLAAMLITSPRRR
jgi:hypothetical protein